MTFDTAVFDPDSFHAGSTFTSITVPSGLGGVYAVGVEVAWSAGPGNSSACALTIAGTDNALPGVATTGLTTLTNQVYSATLELPAATTLGLKLAQTSGGNLNANFRLKLWRIGL